MPRQGIEGTTRQIYASVREDVYLAAKARATELRMPLRQFIEMALELVVAAQDEPVGARPQPSIWDDEYLGMQASQPLGSPVEMTREEAAQVVKGTFGAGSDRS